MAEITVSIQPSVLRHKTMAIVQCDPDVLRLETEKSISEPQAVLEM